MIMRDCKLQNRKCKLQIDLSFDRFSSYYYGNN